MKIKEKLFLNADKFTYYLEDVKQIDKKYSILGKHILQKKNIFNLDASIFQAYCEMPFQSC